VAASSSQSLALSEQRNWRRHIRISSTRRSGEERLHKRTRYARFAKTAGAEGEGENEVDRFLLLDPD